MLTHADPSSTVSAFLEYALVNSYFCVYARTGCSDHSGFSRYVVFFSISRKKTQIESLVVGTRVFSGQWEVEVPSDWSKFPKPSWGDCMFSVLQKALVCSASLEQANKKKDKGPSSFFPHILVVLRLQPYSSRAVYTVFCMQYEISKMLLLS